MDHIALGLILVVIGLALITLRRQLVDKTLKLQKQLFGFWLLGRQARKIGHIYTPIIGWLLILVGLLVLFK